MSNETSVLFVVNFSPWSLYFSPPRNLCGTVPLNKYSILEIPLNKGALHQFCLSVIRFLFLVK